MNQEHKEDPPQKRDENKAANIHKLPSGTATVPDGSSNKRQYKHTTGSDSKTDDRKDAACTGSEDRAQVHSSEGKKEKTSNISGEQSKSSPNEMRSPEASLRNTEKNAALPGATKEPYVSDRGDVVKPQLKEASPSIRHINDETEDQIRATIYGQCIGDAIGLLTEFMSKRNAKKHYGKYKGELELKHKVEDKHRQRWKIGDWTDDSDQMILIMQSVTELNGQVSQTDFAKKLNTWFLEGFKELGDKGCVGLGRLTGQTIEHPVFLENPLEAAETTWRDTGKFSAPNGGVMRTSILGIHEFWNLSKVRDNAVDICTTTHFDPRCQASAVAVSVAIALMLQREKPYFDQVRNTYDVDAIIQRCFECASGCLEATEQKTELSECLFCRDLDSLHLDEADKIGYTFKCLGAGFWALKQQDFRATLTAIVMSGGDADTNGAVAGALLGCKLQRISNLPSIWLDNLEHKYWLNDKIYRYLRVLRKMYRKEDSL